MMAVYVMTHKKINLNVPNYYKKMLVGAYRDTSDTDEYIRDDRFDNISRKNECYCELTGLYWLWKNCDDDIIGLVHYRRFFYKRWKKINENEVLDKKTIEYTLKKYDIIVPVKSYYTESLEDQYNNNHYASDLKRTRKIISEYYPEYINAFEKIMKKNTCHAFNMFIMRKELVNEYCKWLFDILFKLEEQIDISSYDKYQRRIYGFLSERLFNVWIEKNNYKKKEYPVFNNEEKEVHTSKIYYIIRYIQSFLKSKIRFGVGKNKNEKINN